MLVSESKPGGEQICYAFNTYLPFVAVDIRPAQMGSQRKSISHYIPLPQLEICCLLPFSENSDLYRTPFTIPMHYTLSRIVGNSCKKHACHAV